MARLINEDELIKNRVDDYLDKTTSEFTRFLETSPNFVTYYQYNRVQSTQDKGLENVEKIIGSQSPNRFNRIEKFPLYGIDIMSVMQEYSEMGMETNYESDAVILPDTIRPYPGDFFKCEYISEKYLFRVTGVTNDTIRNKPFYRINFQLYEKTESESFIDNYVIGDYVSLFDNIGTQNDNVIAKTDYMLIEYIDKISEELIERYIRNFYRPMLNAITLFCPICGLHLYNRYLTKFLMDNEILKIDKGFRTDIYLTDINPDTACMFENYKKTIYYALEKKDRRIKIREFVEPYEYNFKVNQFVSFGKSYSGMHFVYNESDITMRIFPRDFITNIRLGRLYTEKPNIEELKTTYQQIIFGPDGKPVVVGCGLNKKFKVDEDINENLDIDSLMPEDYIEKNYIIENVIIQYMAGVLKLDTDMLDEINDIDFSLNIYAYSMIPLILYVLKQYKNNLQKTIL